MRCAAIVAVACALIGPWTASSRVWAQIRGGQNLDGQNLGGQLLGGAQSGRQLLKLSVDMAQLTPFPEGTRTLLVGQPGIADVTLLKAGGLGVVTGKSYGETNLIALDANGAALAEWVVRVGARRPDLVVQNGVNRESFICAPQCLPIVDLADAKTTSGDRVAAAAAHLAFSTGR